MTLPSCLQIVDVISASPTIRLDLDDQVFWSVQAESLFPPPPLRRGIASTLLADGEQIAATAYGNRELRLVLKLRSDDADTDATQVQNLVRELDKTTNVIRYTPPGTSTPIFFRTFRASHDALDWEEFERRCSVTIPAEPFALGLREDIATISVSNEPDPTVNLVVNPSLGTDANSWTAVTNCSIARSTSFAAIGSASLAMTATGAGDMTASTSRGTSGIPATAGQSYSAYAAFRAATTTRSVRVNIAWFNAAGSLLSTSTGTTATDTNTGFIARTLIATAPASTAFAALETTIVSAAASEVHYVDTGMFTVGDFTPLYMDGDFGGHWTGTAHASTSVRNAKYFDLTGIKGDVETPLFIEYVDGGAGPERPGLAMGVRSGTPYPVLFQQAESYSVFGADTSTVADTAFSGGSKRRTTFATVATMANRFSGPFPSLSEPTGAENWGIYRVFARVAQTVAGDVIRMKITGLDTVTLKSQTQAQIVDLGTLDSRGGSDVTAGYGGTTYRIETQRTIAIQAERVSGTGSLDYDYLVFVPADQCYGSWAAMNDVTGAQVVLDGPQDAIYRATALSGANPGIIAFASPPARIGSLPVVRPGDNRVVIVQTAPAGSAPTTDSLGTTFSVVVRYWPRYLHVRPAST